MRHPAIMGKVPGFLEAVESAVLTHRTNPDAIGHVHAANVDGSEELRREGAQASAGRHLLLEIEVRNALCGGIMKDLLSAVFGRIGALGNKNREGLDWLLLRDCHGARVALIRNIFSITPYCQRGF